MKKPILLIEDEKLMRVTLEDALRSAGYDVVSFENGSDAIAALKENSFSIVVTDVRLPDTDGFEILKDIIKNKSETLVILMTAFGTIKDAVEAMKLGAFDYITKPFSLDEFILIIERALDVIRLKEENLRLKKDLDRYFSFPNIIGESDKMKEVFSLIERVSKTDSTVLICGESGTGKELIATTIHYQSKRKDKPLIKVNCGAIPETLIESELFGYEKGAFTGALKRKPGRFELASGGTIFLDEIGDLPQGTQAKLLRVLQEMTFERLGGTETIKVDVRIIAATNKDIEEEVKNGNFREDLFYRLNVIPIYIPPLRDRKEDIPLLIEFFLEKYNTRFSKNVRFSKEALEILYGYNYPGNVREVENIIERSVALAVDDVVTREDLPPQFHKGKQKPFISLSKIVSDAEKEHIERVLKATGGNKTKAAEILGISRKTLWEKLNSFRTG